MGDITFEDRAAREFAYMTEDEDGARQLVTPMEWEIETARVSLQQKLDRAELNMVRSVIVGTWPDSENVLRTGILKFWEPVRIAAFARSLLAACLPPVDMAGLETIARLTDELECERALRLEYEQRVAVAEESLRRPLCRCGHAVEDHTEDGWCEMAFCSCLVATPVNAPDEACRNVVKQDPFARGGDETPKTDSDTSEHPKAPQRAPEAKSPTFESSGCPTDETTDAIIEWSGDDLPGLFDFIDEAWNNDFGSQWGSHHPPEERVYVTGGWSGNEELMSALKLNEAFAWARTWQSSHAGGRHEFRLPEATEH